MLVQDRSSPKPTKGNHTAIERLPRTSHAFAETKNLNFSSWVSENLYKIVTFVLFIATVFIFLLLRNTGDAAALQCLQSASNKQNQIHYPELRLNSIKPIIDKSRYSSFRTDRWIIVSVSTHPTESIQNLVKIKGWQVLAVGTSETPQGWNLKGAIFLSLEEQANLGYQVIDHLPYNSFVRKTVGYLYAIQHGAKKIYDADDRGDIIDNNLGKHFDLELVGEEARKETLLQYSHENENRSAVNPYIHFGQRSVWPRGLPLENVGDIGHEEFYTEIYSGKQFIQQGISNGLPDVDSIFYFTRKSRFEAFDIRFDENAPRAALPQGLMAPVNSFNTLFHSPAFWGLMLPVSVSSMASDILRGYWAQRLLWEIGGFLVIYPPTINRIDRIEGYPFSEEKDLHVNVDRLLRFLVNWRSTKPTLFEKILHLSHAMAEEGFWTEQDVKFTAAWLEDLLAIGYQQPRLMSLELHRPRAVIGHGDRKEFIPRKLPSVHLAVEEAGTVNYEIGNLIRWRKYFGNVVLVMYCSGPVNHTALEWRMLYGRIFKNVVLLSEQSNVDLGVEYGQLWKAYKYLPKIFERFTSAEGFLFLQDDTILNYWNLLQADKTKLWITDKVSESWTIVPTSDNSSAWFLKQVDTLKVVVSNLPVHFQTNYRESMEEQKIAFCSSEIFYIPRSFVEDFADLVGLVGDLEVHHKIAVPMFFMAMDSPSNFDSDALGKMIYKANVGSSYDAKSVYSAEAPAIYPWNISSETEFVKVIRAMSSGDPLLLELL